jgi:hypothetical protein
MRDHVPRRPQASDPTVGMVASTRPWFPAVVFGALPALALVGLARVLWRRAAEERAVVSAVALSPLLVLGLQVAVPMMFAPRFVIPLLVAFVASLAIGLEGILAAVAPLELEALLVPLGLALGIAAYQGAVAPRTSSLLRYPYAATRDVADYLAGVGAGPEGRALRAGVGRGAGLVRVYDAVPLVTSRRAILELAERARREERGLYLFFGYVGRNQREHRGALGLVDDRRYFEPVAHLGAIDAGAGFEVVRYTGTPVDAR